MPSVSLSDPERAIRQRLRDDFTHYAARCLRIRTKDGKVEPFALNAAQRHLHERIEAQRTRTGKVRVIILKGRQQGCSTYTEGRFYWRVSHRKGVRAFILTHEQEATNNLFDMAVRFHENCPALVKPSTGASNAKELIFDRLDSGYKVGTAGTKGVGRSSTVQFFHGSEVAFWPFAKDHAAGVMQAIPDAPGTEVVLESTANGIGNWFHEQWQKATAKESEFEAVFIPWFWQPEYRKAIPAGVTFTRTNDEAEIADLHGLDDEQLFWRRGKIAELGSIELFRQEYPCTPDEAFQTSVEQAVVPIALCRSAVARQVQLTNARVIWGLDVARFGNDRSALAQRCGNTLLAPVEHWKGLDTMQTAGRVLAAYRNAEIKPDLICVDVIGVGAGVVDRLQELQLPVSGINVAESPSLEDDRFMRLRDELWFKAREWFESRAVAMPADEALIAELTGVRFKFTSAGKLQVESKDEMKRRGLLSPDLADAFCLTFAASDMRGQHFGGFAPSTFYDS